MKDSDEIHAAESTLLGGRVRVLQPVKGYRAGMDAALLAAALDIKPGERALEAGCGVGGALLQAAARWPHANVVGVERDEAALTLAHTNIGLNGMGERVQVMAAEVAKGPAAFGLGGFDLAFANPPFFDDPNRLRGPAPERAGAWLADDGLEAWTDFLTRAVREGGRVVAIHRADRLHDLLNGLARRAGSFAIRPIQPFAEAPSKRVLVRAIRTGRAPLRLLPPLVLHDKDGANTAQAQAIYRGEAALSWD
jgi:tRNA1(Val) A37 N6-methylase TrmN6